MMTVTLRETRAGDGPLIFEWMRDPAAVRMAAFTSADPADRAAFDICFERNRRRPDSLQCTIEDDGEPVGTIATFEIEGDREVTYWVDRERWGRGIASIALAAMIQLDTTRPLWARTAASNPASARVLSRVGFVQVGEEISYAPGLGRDEREAIHRLDVE